MKTAPAMMFLYYFTKDSLSTRVRLGELFVGSALLIVPAVFGDSSYAFNDEIHLVDNAVLDVGVESFDLVAPSQNTATDHLVGGIDRE